MVLFLNLKSFFKSDKLLSAVFSVMMVVCLVGALFGINYVQCTVDFYNEYETSNKQYTVYTNGQDAAHCVRTFLNEYADKTDYVYAEIPLQLEDQPVKLQAIAHLSDRQFAMLSVSYGTPLSMSDISEGAPKIMLDAVYFDISFLGQTVAAGGTDCRVVGMGSGNYSTFFSISNMTAVERISIVMMSPVYSDETREEFTRYLSETFEGMRVVAPDNVNFMSIFDFAPMLLPTVVLVFLGFVNLAFLYVYFIKIRKKQYAVFRLSGASALNVFLMFAGEILTLFTGAYLISVAGYKALAALFFDGTSSIESMTLSGIAVFDSMNFLRYLAVYLSLAVLFVVAFIGPLLKTVRSDIVVRES